MVYKSINNKIRRKGMISENPTLVNCWRHLHRELPGQKRLLNNASCIDKRLSCKSIDIHGVTIVRQQKFINRVQHTEMPVCCYEKWFNHGMSILTCDHKPIKESCHKFKELKDGLWWQWQNLYMSEAHKLMIAGVIDNNMHLS